MAKQKFGLGRGLDALISGASEVMAAQQPSRVDEESIFQIPIDSIIPNPRQPRRAFREDDPKLLELSASIKQYGLLQPLVVTRLDSSAAPKAAPGGWFSDDDPAAGPDAPAITAVVQYQIIAGERRWRAARMAGLTKIPVVVKEATPQEMLELAMGKIISLKLNVRQAEELAARIKAAERADKATLVSSASLRSPEIEDLEAQFRNALMVKVDLKRNTKGKGTLVLHFNGEDELERLYNRLVQHTE